MTVPPKEVNEPMLLVFAATNSEAIATWEIHSNKMPAVMGLVRDIFIMFIFFKKYRLILPPLPLLVAYFS